MPNMGITPIFSHFKDKLCHSLHNVTENQANGILYESLWRGLSYDTLFLQHFVNDFMQGNDLAFKGQGPQWNYAKYGNYASFCQFNDIL